MDEKARGPNMLPFLRAVLLPSSWARKQNKWNHKGQRIEECHVGICGAICPALESTKNSSQRAKTWAIVLTQREVAKNDLRRSLIGLPIA